MRLATYQHQGRSMIGAIMDDLVLDLQAADAIWQRETIAESSALPGDMIEFLREERALARASRVIAFAERACSSGSELVRAIYHPIGSITLQPPVLRPTKVIGVGANFRSFATQIGELSAYPILFHKTSSSLTGCGSPVVIPPNTDQPVPEGELAVVIGKPGRFIDESCALDHVVGYTCANDVSARNLEFRTSQWTSGKMLDTFCPLGPAIVTPDEIAAVDAFRIRTVLNGRVIQDGATSDLIFPIPRLISEISALVTLEVGDVILTGTPSDLGLVDPPVYLRHGDTIRVEIDGLGVLENPVRAMRIDQ